MPPSAYHEVLVELVRERPTLLTELLRPLLGEQLPDGVPTVTEGVFNQVAPAEFTADLVLLLPGLGIVLEVQLGRDDDKPFVWPLYAMALRARKRCPVALVVLAPRAAVAAWAARPIVPGPGASFRPLVIGPEAIPRVTSGELARGAPELAVLSALAHGNEPDGEAVLEAVAEAFFALPADPAKLYYDLVLSRLMRRSARQVLEDAMAIKNYQYQSEWARNLLAQGASKIVLQQLVRRLGMLGEELHRRVEQLPIERLEALSLDLMDFSSAADLEAWLER